MIYHKAKEEDKDFYELLNHYLLMIRGLHKKTKAHLSKLKASINPLAFTQGGLLFGNLNPDDNITPVLDHMTFSFGITALAELQKLHNGKSLVEDGDFAYDVLTYIKKYIDNATKEDKILYAMYSTPAESLAHTQANQFKNECGIIQGVSDKEYMTNSFHMPVWEDINPIQKQDLEYRYFHVSTGGRIQYCRYPNGNNIEAIKTVVRRAMGMGFYEGVNIEKNYCDDCGTQFDDGHEFCPNCGSHNITQINRVCGYIGYSKVNGTSRMNDGKLAEIADRKSM